MLPVKASGWFNTELLNAERIALLHSGITPVNDVFYELWLYRFAVWLVFGGRGGGKSEVVFERLLRDCLDLPYFRCYYGRKIFETVRGSCFKTIVESIKKLGLTNEFTYSEADNSSMVITCRRNRNQFLPFGADKPDKHKSIKDPTHIVCEEFNQFDFIDFQELFPTLRTPKAICEFFGMFNTKDVYSTHWIIKVFFPELYTGEDKTEMDLGKVEIKKIFANYTDNYFIDKEDYKQRLWLSAGGNPRLFDAIANGAWGITENDNPWLYAFDYDKHCRALTILTGFPIYLSFDVNNDPFTCVASQFSLHRGSNNSFIHILKEFSGSIKVEDICNQILVAFPNSLFHVTGDRSGQNADVGRNKTVYDLIKANLRGRVVKMDLNSKNLEHADSRILLNSMFAHYPNIYIDNKNCPLLLKDIEKATVDEEKGAGHLKKDRDNFKMDLFDGMRYLFQTYFLDFAQKTYFKAINKVNLPNAKR